MKDPSTTSPRTEIGRPGDVLSDGTVIAKADESSLSDLVIVHQITVLDPNGKGWRTTVRIQDGWQGATLTHWSRGGSSVPHGVEKAVDDSRAALGEALGFLRTF